MAAKVNRFQMCTSNQDKGCTALTGGGNSFLINRPRSGRTFWDVCQLCYEIFLDLGGFKDAGDIDMSQRQGVGDSESLWVFRGGGFTTYNMAIQGS